MDINGRKIGNNHPPYIIAELSANHNGKLERALESIKQAKLMGAQAVKIQTYTADTMTIDSRGEDFMITDGGLWNGYSLYELYEEASTPYEWHEDLFKYAKKEGITLFSSPFDETAVDLLEELECPAYKIASFEIVDLPLISYIARLGKPMIISTGIASEHEIQEAVKTAREGGCYQIALLHCISSYPTPPNQSNLAVIKDLAEKFSVISGLSDHSLGITVSIAGAALGASIIEKHFTINKKDKGPDSEFSIEPKELKDLVSQTKTAWESVGTVNYEIKPSEKSSFSSRRSIYVTENLKSGEVLTLKNIRRIRPGKGLAPKFFQRVLKKKVNKDIKKGSPLKWEDVDFK